MSDEHRDVYVTIDAIEKSAGRIDEILTDMKKSDPESYNELKSLIDKANRMQANEDAQ